MKQKVLPVIRDWKGFERFLTSELTWCILLDFHINFMESLIQKAHEANKKVIVHLDLLHGISNDPFGAQFLIQRYHCDGIISTKARVITCAKQNHCLSILRLFLIDSSSVEKGCALANSIQPDFLEALPAMTMHAVSRIRKFTDLPLIGGGLIETKEDIVLCLNSGMVAVSLSDFALCEEMVKGAAL